MSKIRVYELAKDIEVSSKDLITLLLEEFDIKVKNHMSVIDEEDAELIKELFQKKSDSEIGGEKVSVKKDFSKNSKKNNESEDTKDSNTVIEIENTITVKELSEKLQKNSSEVIKQLMFMGLMAGINQEIDFETAEKLASKFEVSLVLKEDDDTLEEMEEEEGTEKRFPVVTVMGHVDHGKTSLLDAIRKSKVIATEAGGITQHIGAYIVDVNGEKITFLDTPGHEAFTSMRARGAQITDIVILVVAADDGVMPQTIEAINHCKAAEVPMIVAINKIDKPSINLDRVKQELSENGVLIEEWGGDVVCVPVSAHSKEGIDSLLEMIILTSEMQELKADPKRKSKGTVIESKLDKGRGPVASLLVQNGTLHVGDSIIVGSSYGRIRAMFDDRGKNIKLAGPSVPVEVLGLSDVPEAGDRFHVVKDEKTAREMAEKRKQKIKEESLKHSAKISLEELYSQIKEGKIKELSIIVKADVQGSVEAISQSLEKLSTETVKVIVIHGGVGAITETDVMLASASNAIIIGFNVRPDGNASNLAEKQSVDIKTYRIIYDALDDVKSAMLGLLEPEYKEVVEGRVQIRQVYKISNVGTIGGAYVQDGKITRNSSVRVIRDGIVIFESTLSSLKRFKDDVKEVAAGYECGLGVEKFNDIKEGDIIEAFKMEEIKPKQL